MVGDRTVQISYSYSEGAKPQQSYLGSAQQPGQLRALGRQEAQPGELGTALDSGYLNSPPRLDFPGNLNHSHLISLCSRFLHLLSAWAHPTSARGKAVVVRGFNEARKKIREKPLPPLPTSKISFSSHSKPQHRTVQKLPNPLFRAGNPKTTAPKCHSRNWWEPRDSSSHNTLSCPEKLTGCCGTTPDSRWPK